MLDLISDRIIRLNQFYASNTPWLTHSPQLKLVNKFGNLNSIITAKLLSSLALPTPSSKSRKGFLSCVCHANPSVPGVCRDHSDPGSED